MNISTRKFPIIPIASCLATAIFMLVTSTALSSGGRLDLTVVDKDTRKPIACRMHLSHAEGRPKKIKGFLAWDDHFVFPGRITLKLPKGSYKFELERGPEYVTRSGHFVIEHFADDAKEVDLRRFVDMAAAGWYSGDLHARRPPRDIELLMLAEDLHVVPAATWWNNKVLHNVKQPRGKRQDGKKQDQTGVVRFDGNRYYSLSAGGFVWPGGEVLCFNLPQPLFRAKPDEEFPAPLELLQKSRGDDDEQDEVDEPPGGRVWIDLTRPYWWDLPMLVAMGQIDSVQIAHGNICRKKTINNEQGGKPRDTTRYPGVRGNPQWTEDVYFNLLECGLRIPPSAGSGSGLAPNPLGYNRMYVHVEGPFSYEKWWRAFAAGRVTITNGPLLRPSVYGKLPGHVFYYEQDETPRFEIGLTLSTRKPISYIELIKNGQLAKSINFAEYSKSGSLPKIEFERSGWFLVRVVTDLPNTYRFAMTAPYYVQIGEQPRISRRAVQFFIDWVYERARQIRMIEDPGKRSAVMQAHRQARDFWQALLSKANAD